MVRRPTLHDVEVVDDDELDPNPAPSAAPARRRHRRALTAGAAVLAVLVTGAVAAQVVADRREDARIAAVAALPGAVAPLAGPPQVLWETARDRQFGVDARAADGTLVGVRASTEGPVLVVGRDPRTGDVVWEVELVDGTTRPAPDSVPGELVATSGACAGLPREEHQVVCLVHDGMAVVDDDGWQTVPSTVARVVLLDTRDGSVAADLSEALVPTSASALAVVGDLVLTTAGPGARVRAVTTDGARRWDLPAPGATTAEDAYVQATALDDLIAIVTPTVVRLVDATGRPVRDVPVPDGLAPSWWVDGVVLLVPEFDEGATDGTSVEARGGVVRPEGVVELTGDPVGVDLDDGSVPGLVLTSDGGALQGWGGDGRRLWSAAVAAPWGAILLDGRLHFTSGATLVTLDARTGEELWRSDATTTSVVTDGRHLLTLVEPTRGEAGPQLVALDPVDGSERWRSALPDGTDSLESYLHLLIAAAHDETTGTTRVRVLG
ncbi:outer membrane protein assembly factor BamB family protein [Cellulomonas wangsupingiae]|uniref:PQQ-binding-like beta-propeller repeat protein n=1 Tax=Cellulomonas wangsupingiae TaxID=2968085 RepID=A0ABY5K2F3_9CELL|nr:PQQ-binding-like beta-propeller repeat protein [Cellulomonas wangsupingiae]MCC2335431.1 PQQ-binding-like beta-propeller repeat protein [Cellulomonas wangsupingiae]UUI64394.1 PQQ-binding-like beta-propeller repeat protein [Cellulomonas wangsupingiae]